MCPLSARLAHAFSHCRIGRTHEPLKKRKKRKKKKVHVCIFDYREREQEKKRSGARNKNEWSLYFFFLSSLWPRKEKKADEQIKHVAAVTSHSSFQIVFLIISCSSAFINRQRGERKIIIRQKKKGRRLPWWSFMRVCVCVYMFKTERRNMNRK